MGGNNILHALRLPYLPPKRTKVFISYTHSCEWSQKMADELYESFNKQNVICFVDKYGIARGSSWRLALHEKLISEATHAICLVSEKTAKKEWPAAEIETALKVRSITGIPNICVLLKEDMNVQETQSYTPVYKEIFNQETQERYGNLFVPVIRNTDGVVSELSKTLSYPDISSGVLGVWSAAWGMVWGLMELLTYYIKGIITVLAGMSFLVWLMVLTIQNRVDMSSMEAGGKALAIHIGNKIEDIVSSGFGLPVFLLACYLVSVELTQIIEGNFYVAYKTRIKSYLISQLIVLALSVACIYMALPCLPETYIILGFLFLMSGFFLTSGANDSVVDAGHCYYRNDSNRGTDTKRRLPG
ncbi:MAG: toll/interleukin-1 receptor domain-containing protein [Tannerella sp.]|nr:toll/interleukin-1 receptor domain-containing protein [Tannerella sp.]